MIHKKLDCQLILIGFSAFLLGGIVRAGKLTIFLYLAQIGINITGIALVSSGFSIVSLFLAYPAGVIIDYIGLRWMIFIGNSLMVVGFLTITKIGDRVIFFTLLSSLLGVGFLFSIISHQLLIGSSSNKSSDVKFSFLMICISSGKMLIPILIGKIYDFKGWNLTIDFLSLGIIISLILTFFISNKKTHNKNNNNSKEIGKILKNNRIIIVMITNFLVICTINNIITFFPVYCNWLGFNATTISLLLALFEFSTIIVRLVQVKVVNLFTRSSACFCILALATPMLILIGLIHYRPALFIILIMTGLSLGLGQPLSMAEIMDIVSKKYIGQVLAIRLTGNRLIKVISPIIFGVLADIWLPLVFLFTGIMLGFGSIWLKAKQKLI